MIKTERNKEQKYREAKKPQTKQEAKTKNRNRKRERVKPRARLVRVATKRKPAVSKSMSQRPKTQVRDDELQSHGQ